MRIAIALIALVALAGCSLSGYSAGLISPEHAGSRAKVGGHIDSMVKVAREDGQAIKDIVKELNAQTPGVGTGVLVGAILPRLALELATDGAIETTPAPE